VRIFLLFIVLAFSTVFAADTPAWKVAVKLSSAKVWQRQQVILSVEISTTDEFARLETQPLEVSDFEIIELPYSASKLDESKAERVIKVGWILFPLVAGKHRIELPRIYYRPSSGQKKKLKLAPQTLLVKSLPSYVPPTMPIGKVQIKNSLAAGKIGRLHNTKTLTNWNINVITNGVLPQTIPPILRQVKSNLALEVLPETITQNAQKSFSGLKNITQYQLPIKALKSGRLALPELSIQYFDPQDNKLKNVVSQAPTHWALNLYLQLLLGSLLILLLLFALYKTFKFINRRMAKQQNIRNAKDKIQQAKNATELRSALNNLSQANGWQANLTLKQWLNHWQNQHGENKMLASAFSDLQSIQFENNSDTNIEKIKANLLGNI